MRKSADGLVPARGFLKAGLAPRPVFNDGSYPEPLEIVTDDKGTRKAVQSLRTPVSNYERRVRYCVLEFEKLLDSSSIDAAGIRSQKPFKETTSFSTASSYSMERTRWRIPLLH
jgi:lysophospholipase